MSLYNKYRPQTLDEFIGNRATVEALKAKLASGNVENRPMLFVGESGCGKTTLARIVATAIQCHPSDMYELDSADFRGIDTIREVRRSMCFKPSRGKCRVWILDEVHQLSKDAQSALLKALEDGPRHCYFILATTDPDKLLPTVRNRCTIYTVAPLGENQMTALIKGVCEAEGKEITDEALNSIVRDSLGSPRAALVILDKIIDLTPEIMAKVAQQQAIEQSQTLELCRALSSRKGWKEVAAIVKELKAEPESVRRAVQGYFCSFLLSSGSPVANNVLEAFSRNFYDSGRAGLVKACYDSCMLNK